MSAKLIFPLWIFVAILLFLYSYTQVDLSLTLSQFSIWQVIQKQFQYIGWFDRPLSTYIYIGIISFLTLLYGLTIWLVSKNKIDKKTLWMIIILVAAILLPSYNAFSYDLFNYIFDARVVTQYGLNPYEFRALDFPQDPMLSFMHSTHRVYPYGPSWLALTVPLTFIGNEIFLFTFYLFKTLGALSFLGTVYFIKKIAEHLKFGNVSLPIVLFALNPLVLVEGLVSSHNEIVMMFFATLGFYFLLKKKYTVSVVGLLISIGVKYSTLALLPVYILKFVYKKIKDRQLMLAILILSTIAVAITALASGPNKNPEFQPWYLLILAPFAALYDSRVTRIIFVSVTVLSLLSYLPLLYMGQWPENIVAQKNLLLAIAIIAPIIGILVYCFTPLKKLSRRLMS